MPALKPKSVQVDLALSILDDDEVELEEDVDKLTSHFNPLDLASLTYGSQVRVISHSREPLRTEVAFWQMKSLSQTVRLLLEQSFVVVEGAAAAEASTLQVPQTLLIPL